MPKSPDEKFRDFLLKHNHYLYRFENGTINQMIEPYKRAKLELIEKLNKLQTEGTGFTLDWRINRLQAQIAEIKVVFGK